MAKKVLVLTASPRTQGNSDKLADAFIAGAQAAGHEVLKFEAAQKSIAGCKACGGCWSDGTACQTKDDFKELEKYLESYDVIVLATPIYWYSFPSQIKSMIDRFYAYGGAGASRPMHIQESVLLVCGEDPSEEAYSTVVYLYNMMGRFLGWEDRGVLVASGLGPADAIDGTGLLERAEEMGRAL